MQREELAAEKGCLIREITPFLPVLRSSIDVSQAEVACRIGISRQTYCAIEQGKRPMSWNTFLSLFLLFQTSKGSRALLERADGFMDRVYQLLEPQKEQRFRAPSGERPELRHLKENQV